MKKIDFTMEKQNGVDVIKYVLGAADVFDERVSDKASELPNVIPFQYQDVDGKRTYTAYAHEDTTLDAYMKNALTKPQVLGILGGLAAIFEIGTKGIPVGYIVKDTSYIYVNTDNITVKAVVFPLKQDNMPLSEIPAFFREVISNMKFHEADVDNYVARIITQINADDFTAGNFKTFINAEMEKIGMFIHKDNGPMNMMVGGGKTPNKDVKVSKVGVMNNMNNMRPMQGAPMGQPMPPMGQPMPPQGQPIPPMGRPMPPQGQPMPPMGRPMPPQGQPMPPMGQPMPPQGQPIPPMGQPMPPQGQPMPPQGQPVPPMGQPVPPQGQPVPSQGAPVPVGMPGMKPMPPQGAPVPVGMPGMPGMPPIGQPAKEEQPQIKDEETSSIEESIEKAEESIEEVKEEKIEEKVEEKIEEKVEEVAEDIKEVSEEVEKKVAEGMPAAPGAPAPMPAMPGMPGMKPQGAPAPMPAAPGVPTGMPGMPGMPGMKPQGVPAPQPVAPAPMPAALGAPTGMPAMPGMPGMKPQGAPAPQPVAPAPMPVAPAPQPVAPEPQTTSEQPASQPVAPPVPQPAAPEPQAMSEQPAPQPTATQGGMVGNLVGKLGDKPVPHLVRKKTGETINLSKPEFTLGKAVGKVDYAITDNTAVSRIHCIIEQKNGVNYIKDNGSTNHTYLDGVELEPQKETLLKNKMTILLGDEEFTFLLRRGE